MRGGTRRHRLNFGSRCYAIRAGLCRSSLAPARPTG